MTAPARPFAVAFRPGRVACWHVVATTGPLTGSSISRHITREPADREAGLLSALTAELAALPRTDRRRALDDATSFARRAAVLADDEARDRRATSAAMRQASDDYDRRNP